MSHTEGIDVSYGRTLLGGGWQINSYPLEQLPEYISGWEPFAATDERLFVRRRVSVWREADGSLTTTTDRTT